MWSWWFLVLYRLYMILSPSQSDLWVWRTLFVSGSIILRSPVLKCIWFREVHICNSSRSVCVTTPTSCTSSPFTMLFAYLSKNYLFASLRWLRYWAKTFAVALHEWQLLFIVSFQVPFIFNGFFIEQSLNVNESNTVIIRKHVVSAHTKD